MRQESGRKTASTRTTVTQTRSGDTSIHRRVAHPAAAARDEAGERVLERALLRGVLARQDEDVEMVEPALSGAVRVDGHEIHVGLGVDRQCRLGGLDADDAAGDEADGERARLARPVGERHTAARHPLDRGLDDVERAVEVLGMRRRDEHAALAVGAAHDRGRAVHPHLELALHRRLRVERPPRLERRARDDVRRRPHAGAAVVAHHELPLGQAERGRALLVEPERREERAALAAAGRPRNDARAPIGVVHQKAAARARADVAAARADERLHLLDAVRPERRELPLASPAGHDEEVESVQRARAHRRAVEEAELHLGRLPDEPEPLDRPDAARAVVGVDAHLERVV